MNFINSLVFLLKQKYVFLFTLVHCLGLTVVSLPSLAEQTLLWEVKSDTATVYLFGSIHVANKSMYPLPNVVENSFAKSDFLVVEVDQQKVDQVKMQEKLLTKGMYSGKETLADNISKDTMELLQQFLRKTKIPYPTISKMRPGMVAITLTVARSAQLGFKPEFGIDLYFMNKARGSKRILQLETADQQLDLLLGFSDQNMLLKHTVLSLDELDTMIATMVQAWKKGDVKTIESITFDEKIKEFPEFKKIFEQLFDKRNISMAQKIESYLGKKNTYFVVVGAGHLVSDAGIVALLNKKGYSVKRY